MKDQLTVLTLMQKARAHANPGPSPLQAAQARRSPDPAWQAAIHAAKKKRVYAARKLNHLGLILHSMQQDLEAQLSDPGPESSARKPRIEKTLEQIRESRALWQTYEDKLNDLSIKLNKILASSGSQPAITIPLNK